MNKERRKTHFIYKGVEYLRSGNDRYDGYFGRITHKGKEMSITVEQFETLLLEDCTYCGSSERITIDRIDSNIGYTPNNCTPACFRCNLMKHTMGQNEFKQHIENIYNHYCK